MKIYAFIQVYNEAITGNLERCLNNCKQWASDIIIYDDKSTDNSVEIAKKFTNHVILGEKNEWTKETFHKQTMLEYIHKMDVKPDWILWIDSDEIVDRKCINELTEFCKTNMDSSIDAFSFQQINLWRGERYYRTDGLLYGDNYKGPGCPGWFVRLWKYHLNMRMNTLVGPDHILFPITIQNIQPCEFKIIHYGFSNYKQLMKHICVHSYTKQELIETANGDIYVKLANNGAEWAKTYVVNGKGVPNMFLNEEQLTVKVCPDTWFPQENIPSVYINYEEPKPFPIKELIIYDDIKTNILFMGNCQVTVIYRYCSYYLKTKIEYLNIVYDLKERTDRVDYLIKNADIIVTQPFYGNQWYYCHNKIQDLKKPSCYMLTIHSLYYDGYFPYCNISNYNDLPQDDNLCDTIIDNSNKSFNELHKRENGEGEYVKIDIPICHFIKDNYKKTRLFLRRNHPSNYLLNFYAYSIYNKIIEEVNYYKNKPITEYNTIFDTSREMLNSKETYEHIDMITYKTLELTFNNNL
uniref:Glycosyltransferase 2-like domain-containing protein n=1 Tax=viral metagenome TaxID=1070528 RepID=A0A6C0E248_9ZZZZ